jgi:hypothetical protein
MRFKAFIHLESRGELTKLTDDRNEAFRWLAQKVARHPDSESYGIFDQRGQKLIHQAGFPPGCAEDTAHFRRF